MAILYSPEGKPLFSAMESEREAMDRAIDRLNGQKQVWATLPVGKKIDYLKRMRKLTEKAAERWVAAAIKAKGIPAQSPLVGEEWISGPWALTFALNRYIATLRAIAKTGYPDLKPNQVHTRPDGQVVVDVFPQSLYDKLLLSGVTGQVWMQPGVTKDNLRETMAVWYRTPNPVGKVTLVLGAGNIASIAPLDVLYKLLAEGQVCLLKMNPVNDYLGPILEEVFGGLVTDGFVQLAYGGVNAGAYLCDHPGIDEIHITGSASTHDAIVFGTGDDGAASKRTSTPQNPRRVTSELGNVSPTIVVPGPWTKADLRFQAEHIMTQKMHNGGFNCIASQVLVLPQQWSLTDALIEAIRVVARETPPRVAYYPGAEKRHAATLTAHPDAEILDQPSDGVVPRTFVHNVPPDQVNDMCFTVEAFNSVLSETRLPGEDAATFLRNAVQFCNETLWGTLGANVIIHPKTIHALGAAFDQAVADLRYGCVAINAWTGVGFLLAPTTWGAFPGHTPDDIQSGIGVVHNSYLFDRAQKSVVSEPFYPYPRSFLHGIFTILPKPPWFVTAKTAAQLGKQLTTFEAHPSLFRLPGIFFNALRG
jgi:acyl-CoA reductase-like NAD-dependent aldehyde dehydrogenase